MRAGRRRPDRADASMRTRDLRSGDSALAFYDMPTLSRLSRDPSIR